MAMAPGLSQIVVCKAAQRGRSGDIILSRMATDNLARQLSSSWTFPVDATTTQMLKEFMAQGQTFFNASGDRRLQRRGPGAGR